jgi:hypothetical protein
VGVPGERDSWESRDVAKVRVVKGYVVGVCKDLGGR